MAIEIGKVKLSKIHRMETLEATNFVYHDVPGKEGSTVQNMGRPSVRLAVEGIFYGDQAAEDMKSLRGVHLKREPVDFMADIVDQAYVGKVVLERFDVTQDASYPSQYAYSLILTEYIEPPAPLGAAVGMVDGAIKMDARDLMDLASLPDALTLGAIPEITNPIEPLKNAMEPVQEAAEGFVKSMQALKDFL